MVSEAEVSMILDTYMYTNYTCANDGDTLRDIVESMPSNIDVEGKYYKEYEILKDAVKNDQIGNLKIQCQSRNMGYNEGTNAVTFVNESSKENYVVFRGTADGEWLDNGEGMNSKSTGQQEEAVKYYEEVVKKLGITTAERLYVSGHSKGGNKVQFITMDSALSYLITACYSIDGQGMSELAIEEWKERYGEEEYNVRINKIYGINGENDFVSVLGNCIIPISHIKYVNTPCETTNIAGCHDITMMFAKKQETDDGVSYTYSSKKNDYVLSRGKLADYADLVSDEIMNVPPLFREGSTATIMQLVEILNGGTLTGMKNEFIGNDDIEKFKRVGVPILISTLFGSREGLGLINGFIINDGLVNKNEGLKDVRINYLYLKEISDNMLQNSAKVTRVLMELDIAGSMIPLYFDGYNYRKPHIDNSVVKLKVMESGLKKAANILAKISELYQAFDSKDYGFR